MPSMEFGKYKTREVQQTILRLHPDLREALVKLAEGNNRSLTKEISERLKNSLPARGPTMQKWLAKDLNPPDGAAPGIAPGALPPSYTEGPTPALTANDNGPAPALSSLDHAMLDVFHALPVEKQLALLSLFK